MGRGGLNPYPDGLGQLFWEELLDFGGSRPGWFGALFFGDEVPQSARLSAGGGMQSLFGQCPNAFVINFNGASLSQLNPQISSFDLFVCTIWIIWILFYIFFEENTKLTFQHFCLASLQLLHTGTNFSIRDKYNDHDEVKMESPKSPLSWGYIIRFFLCFSSLVARYAFRH